MHKLRFVAAISLASVLAGCAINQPSTVNAPLSAEAEILTRIAAHAQKASDSMQRLASIRGANETVKIEDVAIPTGLEMPISINWNGPIENLAKKVAEMTGYGYEGYMGARPVTPVSVSISVTNVKAFNILLDAGMQAGAAADIIIRPDARTLLVKYPPTLRTGSMPVVR